VVAVADRAEALFADEAARLEGMAARRRATFSSGRAAARAARAAAGCPPGPIGTLGGAPLAPEGWRVTISHTDDIAVAAACRRGEGVAGIGIDIEAVARMDPALRRYVVREHDRIPADAGPEILTRAFALREAVFKALDPGMQAGTRRIDLTWREDGTMTAAVASAPDLRLDQRIAVADGQVLAVCVRYGPDGGG
jgi:4'-phosphopantetheinyl transferase EntD